MQQDPLSWQLHLKLSPTADGRFLRLKLQTLLPDQKIPAEQSHAQPTDLVFEKAEEMLKNGLRQLCNNLERECKTRKQTNVQRS